MDYNFQILTDSVSDLPKSWLAKHPFVSIVDTPVNVTKGKECFTLHNLGPDDFPQVETYVKQGYRASTSQPLVNDPYSSSPDSVETITRKWLDAGKDVIYVVMNSSLSGTYGITAALYEELSKEYEGRGRKLICVDSKCMSTGLALLMLDIATGVESGQLSNIEQIAQFVNEQCFHMGHYFTWGELSYIRKSGRVSAVSAIIGNLLGIRLFCSAQYLPNGERKLEHVTPSHPVMIKIRGINKLAEILGVYAERHIVDPTGTIIIAHGNAPRDAGLIYNRLREHLPNANYLIGPEWRCGAGIQAHSGPTSIHVNFHVNKLERLDETSAEVEQIVRDLYRL